MERIFVPKGTPINDGHPVAGCHDPVKDHIIGTFHDHIDLDAPFLEQLIHLVPDLAGSIEGDKIHPLEILHLQAFPPGQRMMFRHQSHQRMVPHITGPNLGGIDPGAEDQVHFPFQQIFPQVIPALGTVLELDPQPVGLAPVPDQQIRCKGLHRVKSCTIDTPGVGIGIFLQGIDS